jgi:hypothetical protein
MGWTADDDTLAQVELCFPSAESAVAYARRQGLSFTVAGWTEPKPELKVISSGRPSSEEAARNWRRRLEWIERTLGADFLHRKPGPGGGPASVYADPQDVVHASDLTDEQKREVLYRWAHDSYVLERDASPGSIAPSRLDEVVGALHDLEMNPQGASAVRRAA